MNKKIHEHKHTHAQVRVRYNQNSISSTKIDFSNYFVKLFEKCTFKCPE